MTGTQQGDSAAQTNATTEFVNTIKRWPLVIGSGLVASGLGLGVAFFIPPTFTAYTSFVTPQPQQGAAASALASLGSLGALAGAAGMRNNADQYASFMQSSKLGNRLISKFDLGTVYETELITDTLKQLKKNTRISVGKKDGLITIEVDDRDAVRAAALANSYVEELQALIDGLALTEAKARRIFFERQLQAVDAQLSLAESKLASAGISVDLIKSEPKAAAETIARLNAELTSSEVKLEAMRQSMSERAPDIIKQHAQIAALKSQLNRLETQNSPNPPNKRGYIGAYREFKYQEALFEILTKQLEIAKLDEAKEGSPIQVIDIATTPERKSRPKHSLIGILSFLTGAAAAFLFLWRKQVAINRKQIIANNA